MYNYFSDLSPSTYPEFYSILEAVRNNPSLQDIKPPSDDSSIEEFKACVVKCALCSPIRDIMKDFTPFTKAYRLSKMNNNNVFLKREECTPVYSFKIRGAFTKISSMLAELKKTGVYSCSAGNHAQGVAYSATHYGISSKIYMPNGATSIKIDSVKNMGGEVCQVGETIDDCFQYSSTVNDGRFLIHPFNDVFIIGGQATLALELMKQCDVMSLDYLFSPCGGGGITAGASTVLKMINPNIKIIGVEATEAPGMTVSIKEGKVTTVHNIGKFADGAAIRTIGELTFKLCNDLIDEMILVSTSEICQAISDTFSDIRMVLEPAGALGVAGMKKYCMNNGVKHKNCLVLTTGANIDFKLLKFISENIETAENSPLQQAPTDPAHNSENNEPSEHRFSILLPEHPGSVKSLLSALNAANITEIVYNHSHIQSKKLSNMILGLNLDSLSETEYLLTSLKDKGYDPWEITHNDLANHHAKPSSMGGDAIKENEMILRFEYSEKSNTTSRIFDEISGSWDLSRIHFEYDSDKCHLLIGIYTNNQSKYEIQNFLELIKTFDIKCADETYNPLIPRLISF